MTFRTIRNLDFEADFDSREWQNVAIDICRHAGVEFTAVKRADSSDHVVFLIDERFLLKIFRPWRNCFARESNALEFVSGRLDLQTPEIVRTGNFEGVDFLITTQVSGMPFTRTEFLQLPRIDQFAICNDLASCLKQLHDLDPSPFTDDWADFIRDRSDTFVERQIKHGVNPDIISSLPEFIDAHFSAVPVQPTVFLHGDLHFGNLRLHRINGRLRIAGLFDFADSRRGFHEYDFLAVGVLMFQGERDLQREFFRAYGYSKNDLDEAMRKRLMMQTMLYETSDLRRYALRLGTSAVDLTLEELESAIWSFVNV
jgi:aminoglycoside phosphotransferase (APT) family kinase protein